MLQHMHWYIYIQTPPNLLPLNQDLKHQNKQASTSLHTDYLTNEPNQTKLAIETATASATTTTRLLLLVQIRETIGYRIISNRQPRQLIHHSQ